jgi:hypothetical protein
MRPSVRMLTVVKTAIVASMLALTLQGCVVRPAREVRIVEPCPPGSHPGPYGHRCFAN